MEFMQALVFIGKAICLMVGISALAVIFLMLKEGPFSDVDKKNRP